MIEFHEEAALELEQAVDDYEHRSPGLGLRLLDAIERVLARIADHPGLGAPVSLPESGRQVRRVLLRRFPFGIYYVERASALVVLAVAHTRRRPGYWHHRH